MRGVERCLAADEIQAVLFRRYLSDWKHRKLSSIKKSEVQARNESNGARQWVRPLRNHTLTYAKAAINWCHKNGLTAV